MATSQAGLVEFSLVGGRGKLVTSAPKSAAESKQQQRGDRICNSHGEISAQQAFAALEDPNYVRQIQKITLSTKSFTLPAAELLCEKIKQMVNLEVADISDTISGIVEAEAYPVLKAFGSALATLPKLREFHCDRNAIGPRVDAFAGILTGNIETVSLCVTGMSALACERTAKYFIDNGPLPLNLRALRFAESTSNSGGAIAISTLFKHCPKLTDFRLASIRSSSDGMAAVCKELHAAAPPIERLDLSDNNFMTDDCDAGPPLCAALQSLAPTLIEVNLNYIGRGGLMTTISDGLAACVNLRSLSYRGNEATRVDWNHFGRLLGNHLPQLQVLVMSEFYISVNYYYFLKYIY